MIFIYDIFINLNKEFFDFYEWEELDNISHVRKSPLLKVKSKTIDKLIEKSLILEKPFLETIYNKCEIFSNKQIEYLEYGCIFSDENKSVFCMFDKDGNINKLSSISISEELEILEIVETLSEKEISYKEINKKHIKSNLTREQKKAMNFILSELDKIKNDKEKIEYLYYEWFNEKECSYSKLIKDINKKFTNKHLEFLELLKLFV